MVLIIKSQSQVATPSNCREVPLMCIIFVYAQHFFFLLSYFVATKQFFFWEGKAEMLLKRITRSQVHSSI